MDYDTAFVNLDLVKGKGELKFISTTSDGGPNIDAFGFSVDHVCRANDDNGEVAMGLRGKRLLLPSGGPAHVSVYDMTGRLVAPKRVEISSHCCDISPGCLGGFYQFHHPYRRRFCRLHLQG